MKGNPKICPKPCPSVSFDVNTVEIPCTEIDETITHAKEIQPVELQEISEVESMAISESDIDPFETMYVKWMKKVLIE